LKVEFDGIEYEVKLTPRVWPLLVFIEDRRINAPKNPEEAVKRGEELEAALEKVMEICVTPMPPRHLWPKFLALINLEDNRTLKEAVDFYESFRRSAGTER